MKIDSIRTYKSAFQLLSSALIIVVIVCLAAVGALGFLLFKESQKGYQSVWIIDPKSKQTFRAEQVLSSANPERIFEYKNQVDLFYTNWFEFDQFNYQRHIDKGLTMVGNCGKELYNDYKTQDLQRKLSEKNMKVTIKVDSILIDMNSTPARGACYAIQTFESPAGKANRRMYSTFNIIDQAGRSDINPHGCLIENFKVFDNSQIIENE